MKYCKKVRVEIETSDEYDLIIRKFFMDYDTLITWSEALESDQSRRFISNFIEVYDKQPSMVALLGYENSLLNGYLEDGELMNEPLNSPCGEVKIDNKTNRLDVSHYLWELKSRKNRTFEN